MHLEALRSGVPSRAVGEYFSEARPKVMKEISAGSPVANEMQLYAAKHLETDKLYYLFRSYLNTEDSDEKFLLQADLEGDFITNASLKKIYRRIFGQPVKYNVNFSKTKHCRDYFSFMSHLFNQMSFHGWALLIDETELMGRLGKKTRLKAYNNMADFLLPDLCPETTFTQSSFRSAAASVPDERGN